MFKHKNRLIMITSFSILFLATVLYVGSYYYESETISPGLSTVVTLEIQGMNWAGCILAVSRALNQLEGVLDADVDFHSSTAIVSYKPSEVNMFMILSATDKAGFPSRVITVEN